MVAVGPELIARLDQFDRRYRPRDRFVVKHYFGGFHRSVSLRREFLLNEPRILVQHFLHGILIHEIWIATRTECARNDEFL